MVSVYILYNDASLQVTTVCGVGLGSISQVAIGVDLGADRKMQGMLALLSLHSSRVTRVFHFTHKVRFVIVCICFIMINRSCVDHLAMNFVDCNLV